MIQSIKNLEQSNETASMKGNVLSGIRAFLSDNNDGKVKDIVPNDTKVSKITSYAVNSKYHKIFVASTNRYIIKNNNIFGQSGGSKFYSPIDKNKGLYVFASMHNGRMIHSDSFIKDYVKTAIYYEKKGIFPTIYCWTYVDLDLKVTKMHRPDRKEIVGLEGKAFALITKRISSPNYVLDTNNSCHLEFLKKVWKDKTMYPTLLKKKIFINIFGREFFVENPKFRLDKQKRFCRIVRKRYISTASHLRLRNKVKGKVRKLDDKYGNVLYCKKDKKWYFVDLD